MKYLKIKYRLLVYFTRFTVCSRDIKKISENGKLTGHFQSFYFRPPDPKSEKSKSTNREIWPKLYFQKRHSFILAFLCNAQNVQRKIILHNCVNS